MVFDWVGVILEHVQSALKASEQFTPNFPVLSLSLACLLAFVACTTTATTFISSSELITSQLQNQSS